jgi:hypothetical protein
LDNGDPQTFSSIFGVTPRTVTGAPAKKFHRIVQPDEYGVPLSAGDKLELSVMSRLSVTAVASTAFSAGWSHIRDSDPHYGTDSGAFGERMGALAIKQSTEAVLSYGVFAGLFHDDPRYYVMGPQKKLAVRALYSATRVFVTQTDDGRAAVNWPKVAGSAGAIALTNLYYPTSDHGFGNGAAAFCDSFFSSILTNELTEFIGDGVRLIRHNRNQSKD